MCIDQLRRIASGQNGTVSVTIALAGGATYSQRTMNLYGDGWDVWNAMTDTWDTYENDDELIAGDPHIAVAIDNDSLYAQAAVQVKHD